MGHVTYDNLQTLECIGSNKISYGGLRRNNIIDAPRSGKHTGSRVRPSQDKAGSRVRSQKWQGTGKRVTPRPHEEARLVTYDADGRTPAFMMCRADVIGSRYITYWTGD